MILNINKPLGLTSFDVVAYVRRATGEKKVGHAGTLDPMATGVLVVAVGRESTKQIDQLMSGEKEYLAEIILGAETDSLDRDGLLIKTAQVPPLTKAQIDAAVEFFVGTIAQVPPSFSAIHVQGERAYDLARAGKPVNIPPRIVTINKIEVLNYPITLSPFPQLTIKVTCEKGVYIRSLARDIGQKLGTVAFLKSLVRTKVGTYRIEDSISLSAIRYPLSAA